MESKKERDIVENVKIVERVRVYKKRDEPNLNHFSVMN